MSRPALSRALDAAIGIRHEEEHVCPQCGDTGHVTGYEFHGPIDWRCDCPAGQRPEPVPSGMEPPADGEWRDVPF